MPKSPFPLLTRGAQNAEAFYHRINISPVAPGVVRASPGTQTATRGRLAANKSNTSSIRDETVRLRVGKRLPT